MLSGQSLLCKLEDPRSDPQTSKGWKVASRDNGRETVSCQVLGRGVVLQNKELYGMGVLPVMAVLRQGALNATKLHTENPIMRLLSWLSCDALP